MIGSPDRPPVKSSDGGNWVYSASLGVFLFLVYMFNPLLFFDPDTLPAMLLPIAVIRGDGPFLDRFVEVLPESTVPGVRLPYFVAETRGHLVSRYPVGPAILAMPVVLAEVMILDRFRPGWDREKTEFLGWCTLMAKVSAAVITAAASVALLHLLRGMGLARVALPTTLAAALGTSFWTVASQSLWQHGPAALALTLTMILLLPQPASHPGASGRRHDGGDGVLPHDGSGIRCRGPPLRRPPPKALPRVVLAHADHGRRGTHCLQRLVFRRYRRRCDAHRGPTPSAPSRGGDLVGESAGWCARHFFLPQPWSLRVQPLDCPRTGFSPRVRSASPALAAHPIPTLVTCSIRRRALEIRGLVGWALFWSALLD